MSLEVDDIDSHYTYTSGWTIESSPQQYGGSSHCTSTDGSSVTLHFRGKYIVIYATIPTSNSPTFSEYTRIDLQIDNGPTRTLTQRALPGPIYSHPIYESSGLAETDHTLKLTFVDRADTTRFCLDRIGISSDIGSEYVPELLDTPAERRWMRLEKRDVGDRDDLPMTQMGEQPSATGTGHSLSNAKGYSSEDMRSTALAFGGLVIALLLLFVFRVLLRRRRAVGELTL